MKNNKINKYADISAGDAFIAGHFRDWADAHKNKITKTQFVHLIAIFEEYYVAVFEERHNPDKMARHLNLMFNDINQEATK